jgi:hypothetical protein
MGAFKVYKKGVFCLEGDWNRDLTRSPSVEPILELLCRAEDYCMPYLHRHVATRHDLAHHLTTWTQKKYSSFPILYLAFHGDPGTIKVSDRRRGMNLVSLDILEEQLRGKCGGRIIHFGSCATLAVGGRRVDAFLQATGALAVCGYLDYVDWLKSTAFDLLVLSAMQQNTLTPSGVRAMQRRISREAPGLAKELTFRMIVRKGTRRAPRKE